MQLTIPDFCLIAVIGKITTSALARAGFAAGDVLAGDDAGLETAAARLARRELTVVAAEGESRAEIEALVHFAKAWYAQPVALVDGEALKDRLSKSGFHAVHVLDGRPDVEVKLEPLAVDRRGEAGPFDIIGDVHGCADELVELMEKIGYRIALTGEGEARRAELTPPSGRRAVFVGDLCDRGPNVPDVMRIVMALGETGQGLCVPGNHDVKFMRWLAGRDVKPTHGFDRTMAQMNREPASFKPLVKAFFDTLPIHLWLDSGHLAVAHAGVPETMIGRQTGAVREHCLYGDTDGEQDANGLAIRYNWAADYRGDAVVVYGHTPVAEATWLNDTVCIDTGCCFGGKLTALRWPEREIVSVPARAVYETRKRPFGLPGLRADLTA